MKAYFIVFFFGVTKFLLSPFIGINGFGLSIFETYITVSMGGIFGSTVFFFLGNKLMDRNHKKKIIKRAQLIKEGKPLPKVFTKTNKTIIKVKQALGIWGLAILTTVLLSIPVGSIICAKFYHHKKSSIFIIYFFILLNSLILSFIANQFPSIGI